MKWLLLLDTVFSLIVAICFEYRFPATRFVFNAVRLHIDHEANAIFAIAAVRLVWCFRDVNGDFIRMPPLSALPAEWRELLQRPFSLKAFLAGLTTSALVGAMAMAVFAVVFPLSHKDAYFPAVFILAAGAFPCGVGIARALIKKELEKRAIAQAEKAAQAKAAEMTLTRELEAQKRAEAEEAAEMALAELGRTQRLFNGFARRNMRLDNERAAAVLTARRADLQLMRTRSANRRAQAQLARTTAALAAAEQQIVALREEALQLQAALLEQGGHVMAWGLETMRPSEKISAEEVRAIIAALNPDSPAYCPGLKVAAKVLILLQTAPPKTKKALGPKAVVYHYKRELTDFMHKAGILNQFGGPNETLLLGAVQVAMARPGPKGDEQ